MTRQQRQARRVIAAAAVARRLAAHDEALRAADPASAAEYVQALFAANSRALRAGSAYSDRYGVSTLAEVARDAGLVSWNGPRAA